MQLSLNIHGSYLLRNNERTITLTIKGVQKCGNKGMRVCVWTLKQAIQVFPPVRLSDEVRLTFCSSSSGVNCEINHNDCLSNPCQHGVCKDGINKYTCVCKPGYTGTYTHTHPCIHLHFHILHIVHIPFINISVTNVNQSFTQTHTHRLFLTLPSPSICIFLPFSCLLFSHSFIYVSYFSPIFISFPHYSLPWFCFCSHLYFSYPSFIPPSCISFFLYLSIMSLSLSFSAPCFFLNYFFPIILISPFLHLSFVFLLSLSFSILFFYLLLKSFPFLSYFLSFPSLFFSVFLLLS